MKKEQTYHPPAPSEPSRGDPDRDFLLHHIDKLEKQLAHAQAQNKKLTIRNAKLETKVEIMETQIQQLNQFNGTVYQIGTQNNYYNPQLTPSVSPTSDVDQSSSVSSNSMLDHPSSPAAANESQILLFKYIHYEVTSESERNEIHKQICNIVHLPKIQLVCDALLELIKARKILSTIDQSAMLAELRRLGLPSDIKGFSDQNFYSYYRTK